MMNDLGWNPLRSQAVLIGIGSYQKLTQVPAALNSLVRMRELLESGCCSWPSNRIETFTDLERPDGRLPDTLLRLFRAARDVALFYFVGHGLIDPEDSLCLCLADTSGEGARRRTTSQSFEDVRYAL